MKLRRTLLASAAAASLMPLGFASANAHVTVKADTTEAGAYSVLTLAASHGCEGSPTASFTISIPDSIVDAKPTIYPGWDVKKIEEKLKEPLTTEDGSTITKHVGKVVYTAQTPLEDGYRIAFEIQVQNPDNAGEILAFPTLQTCEKGNTDWSQLPTEGEDPHALEAPAPSYVLTPASSDTHHQTAVNTTDNTVGERGIQNVTASNNGASPVLGYLGLGTGIMGLVAGGIALSRTRKTADK